MRNRRPDVADDVLASVLVELARTIRALTQEIRALREALEKEEADAGD
jgi:hypothetical protein